MYRSPADPPPGGPLVTVRRYLDAIAAELDRVKLEAEGVTAYVIEAARFNPALNAALGGVQLQVGERDVHRVEAILGREAPEESEVTADDGEGPDAVRCPRCELAYCFHERARARASTAFSLVPLLMGALLVFSSRKRWRCHKCGHVWDDPKEGPAQVTPLGPDDPRPVFRLRRAHPGMGLFVGAIIGFLGSLAARTVDPIGNLLIVAGPLVGWFVGRSMQYDLCSLPGCRAPLPSDAETCPRCGGAVAGVIRRAEAHFSAAADFRRELAEVHRKKAKKKPSAKRKQASAAGA